MTNEKKKLSKGPRDIFMRFGFDSDQMPYSIILDQFGLRPQDEYCTCAETLLHDEKGNEYRVPKPRFHNCEHIARIR